MNDQLFERVQSLAKPHTSDISEFIFGYNIWHLRVALRAFTKKTLSLSAARDNAAMCSLKSRLMALLTTYPGIGRNYEILSEHVTRDNRRIDLYLKSKHKDLKHQVIEFRSVPLDWLDPSHWVPECTQFTLENKKEVAKEIARMPAGELLHLPLNRMLQRSWPVKDSTVEEYVKAGRSRITEYLKDLDKQEQQHTLGYLIWDVGEAINVERITV